VQNTTRLHIFRFAALVILFVVFWLFFFRRGQASLTAKSVVIATSAFVLGCSAAAVWLWRVRLSRRALSPVCSRSASGGHPHHLIGFCPGLFYSADMETSAP
jgi:hypothetical protein